jgi:hypothetical protein
MFGFAGKASKFGLGVLAMGAAIVGFSMTSTEEATAGSIPLPTFVSVQCSNPGSSQDVAKTPAIKNTSLTTLYKGQRINWYASDGDLGQVTLGADLPPGATVKAMGKAGNGYTCTSSYVAMPDLKIRQAKVVSSTEAMVEVQNADPYSTAPGSAVLFELRSCNTNAVLATSKSANIALGKGEFKAITFALPATAQVPGRKYVRAVADVDARVSESNEQNNLWNSQSSCLY